MGDMLLTSVPEGWESNPHKNQVVQPTSYALVVCLSIPLRNNMLCKFQTNGSQTNDVTQNVTYLNDAEISSESNAHKKMWFFQVFT